MSSRGKSKCEATQNSDEAVLDISDRECSRQLYDCPQNDNSDRQCGKCFHDSMLCTDDEILIIDSISSENKLLLKESCPSFHGRDYVEKIEEFQYYIEMVARPGCSLERLNVALSLMSSLVKKLSVISFKQHIHASL